MPIIRTARDLKNYLNSLSEGELDGRLLVDDEYDMLDASMYYDPVTTEQRLRLDATVNEETYDGPPLAEPKPDYGYKCKNNHPCCADWRDGMWHAKACDGGHKCGDCGELLDIPVPEGTVFAHVDSADEDTANRQLYEGEVSRGYYSDPV